MKTLLFSVIIVLLACQLSAQQQPNILPKAGTHHSLMLRHAYPNQNQKTTLSVEMDFRLPTKPNTEITIRVDSLFFLDECGNFKRIYSYDANGNMLTELLKHLENSAWVNSSLSTYTYDVNGNMLTLLYQDWENGVWVNEWFDTYTYNGNGNMLTRLYQDWENGTLVNGGLYTYTYDANGNSLTMLYQYWENNAWVNYGLVTFTYNTNGNRLTELYQYWENGAWVNSYLSTDTYNDNGNRLTQLYQHWENGVWVNSSLSTYTNNTNGTILTSLRQIWENGAWVNDQSYTYTYDDSGNRLTELYQYWVYGIIWMNSSLNTYTYDTNGNRLIELYQYWGNSTWMNYHKNEYIFLPGKVNAIAYEWDGSNWIQSTYDASLDIFMGRENVFFYHAINLELYYTDITGIKEQDVCLGKPIHCYPNPVTDHINLKINPAWQSVYYLLELYSQTGQKVKSFEISSDFGSSTLPLSVEDVPPGLYLLRITSGKQMFSQKIIISR